MPQLPDRPDSDQLRPQARELQRAAQGGDADALRRLRSVSDTDELVDGQYADRPQLRPVLDAVLAAASALGPVTVQARKTCVNVLIDGFDLPGLSCHPEPDGTVHRIARICLTDANGNPVCARVHPPALTWSVQKCG